MQRPDRRHVPLSAVCCANVTCGAKTLPTREWTPVRRRLVVAQAFRPQPVRSRKLTDSQGLVWIVPNNCRNPSRHAAPPRGARRGARCACGPGSARAAARIPRGVSSIWIVAGPALPQPTAPSRRECRKRFLRASERLCNVPSPPRFRGFKQSSGVHAHPS